MFDFTIYIAALRANEEKAELVREYEALNPGFLERGLEEQGWYVNYIQNFTTVPIRLPEEFQNDFDWDLLQKLVAGSFSNKGSLEPTDEHEFPELGISVSSGDINITKVVSELSILQVLRLYEIYCEEQMKLHILVQEDEKEKVAINVQQSANFIQWNSELQKVGSSQENLLDCLPIPKEILNDLLPSKDDSVCSSGQAKTSLVFDVARCIDNLAQDDRHKEVIAYLKEKVPNELKKPLKEQEWFKEYVSKFTGGLSYRVPCSLVEDIDWELLLMLVGASFSSSFQYGEEKEGVYELEIDVAMGNQVVIKRVSELSRMQLNKLFEIYIHEQIAMYKLIIEGDEREVKEINQQRESKLINWHSIIDEQQIYRMLGE